jgi:PAS domain S-box-containing protein
MSFSHATSAEKKSQLVLLVVLLGLLIAVGSYLYYRSEANRIREQKYNELKAVTDLKQQQIETWIESRFKETDVITESSVFISVISKWFQNIKNERLKHEVNQWLMQFQKKLDYENIFLITPDGKLLISAKPHLGEFESRVKQKLIEAAKVREIVLTDFYYSNTENKIHYDIIVPIELNGKLIASILFREDPNKYLYPLIQNWPIPSKTAETMILRVEDDSLLFLNELRHRRNTALKLRIPLTDMEKPSVQAALGRIGFFEGIDYRGVEVVSDIRTFPKTNWIMVSKIDRSEIYSGLTFTASIIFGIGFLLIIICAGGFVLYYNSRQKGVFKELYLKEKEIWQQQEKFKVTIDSLGEGVITLDANGIVQYMNNLAEKLTGWNLREARGRHLNEIYPVKNEETGQMENSIIDKIFKQGIVKELANHTILISKEGKEIPITDTGAPVYDIDGSILGVVITFQDEIDKRMQQKLLRESEVRLRSTLDSMIEGCQIISFNWRYLFLNKTALNHAKLPKEELIGKTMMECYPGIENTEMFNVLQYCMTERKAENMENKFTYPDGSSRYFKLNFEPVPEGMFILSEDITEKKLTEEKIRTNEKFLSSLFNTVADTIFTISMPERIIVNVNRAVTDMFGYQPEEVIGKQIKIFYPNELAFLEYDKKLSNAVENNLSIIKDELNLVKNDGSKIWCRAQTTFIKKDGSVEQVIKVLSDITEQKKMINELIEARERAEEANRLKSGFISAMSHEIRTPLNVILGYCDVVRDLYSKPSDEEAQNYFSFINSNGQRLIDTITKILDISRIEAGEFPISRQVISINEVVGHMSSSLKILTEKKGLNFILKLPEEDLVIFADLYCLENSIINLVSNAIKYSVKGTVEITAFREDDLCVVKIKDEGIGMSESYQKHLFQTFSQEVVGTSRPFEGVGLGLALTKKYMDNMNGSISIQSKQGVGTTVTLKLPLAK